MQKPPLYEARPESLPTKFNLYFADLKQVFLECTLAKNSQQLLQEKYGVYCPLKDPGACIERHLAFFNQQFYELYPNAVRLEYNLPSCNAIGLAYDTSNPGLFSGSQSEVFMTHVDYGNERLSFLSKVFKPVTPRQFQPRIGLARPILVSQEDQRNARRNDKGAYYRELEAYQSLRHSPYFLHPVCHWEEHLTIAYPYFDAGDMVPLVEDDNDILKRVNIDAVMRRVSRQLIEAVHQMHMAGIAHMDIKPENILIAGRSRDERLDFFLNPKSTVKIALIDLGLSVKKVDLQGIGCFRLGTKTTMSPEQLMCHRPLSMAADWWGVGATLWRLMVMWSPGMSEDVKNKLLEAKDKYFQHPIFTPIHSKQFMELIDELLQLYPEHRQFDEDIEKLLSLPYLRPA